MNDKRAFGYVFGSPDTGHQFFGVKTEKDAGQVSQRKVTTSGFFVMVGRFS